MFKQIKLTGVVSVGFSLILNLIFPFATVSYPDRQEETPSGPNVTTMEIDTDTLPEQVSNNFFKMETNIQKEFEGYFGRTLAQVTHGPKEIAEILTRLGEQTNSNPAVLWIMPTANYLHLVLLLPNGELIIKDLHDVPLETIKNTANQFTKTVTNARRPLQLAPLQQLHQWLIEPLEEEYLKPNNIDTLLFCVGGGLRGIPLAALHDGEQFLIEKYGLTHIPGFNLINTAYQPMEEKRILAMGAEEFANNNPLPAVPVELSTIANKNSQSSQSNPFFLNQDFTLNNLRENLENNSFNIVHLATHALFMAGAPSQSYIQLWDQQLSLDQVHTLNWNDPPVELLVLSACQTALGDEEAEMGFAGLALEAGVKSVLGSLWFVSDLGTLAFMTEFYGQLGKTQTKAEAVRQTQIKMLKGEVKLTRDQLLLSMNQINLPESLMGFVENNFSHPYYWASFTLISSPW